MKKFKEPLPQGGVPFFADDFLMLQAELLKASLYMYSSLNTEMILSGCEPALSGVYPTVGIVSISSGYVLIRDRLNMNKPEIYFVPPTTFGSAVPNAWIIPDADVEESRTLKSGTTTGVLVTKTAKVVVDPDAPDPSYPQIVFNPMPSVTLKSLLFKNSKHIGEVTAIGLLPPFRSNPLFGPNGIPFFQETTVPGIQAGFGRYEYEGFAICNGLNNTPDLRRRALVGYDNSHSRYSSIGNIGGAEEVYLYKEYIPQHTHTGNTSPAGAHTHRLYKYSGQTNFSPNVAFADSRFMTVNSSGANRDALSEGVEPVGNHDHVFTTNGGDGLQNKPHDNRSPYYTTMYIQRIA